MGQSVTKNKDYIFFGHGWDIDKNINLYGKRNVNIIALQDSCILSEEPDFKHLSLLVGTTDVITYYKQLASYAKKNGINLGVYSSNTKYNKVPNMLLSTIPKHNELTRLHDVQTNKQIKIKNVLTLSEVIDYLGDNFTLVIWACKVPLGEFQIKQLKEGNWGDKDGMEKSRILLDFIDEKNIKPNETGRQEPNIPFREFLKMGKGIEYDYRKTQPPVKEIERILKDKDVKDINIKGNIGSYSWFMGLGREPYNLTKQQINLVKTEYSQLAELGQTKEKVSYNIQRFIKNLLDQTR